MSKDQSKKKPAGQSARGAKADTIHVTINPASKGQITGTVKAAPATPAPVDRAAALSSAARKAWETRRANGWVHPSAKTVTAPAPVSATPPAHSAAKGSKPGKTTKAKAKTAKAKGKASRKSAA